MRRAFPIVLILTFCATSSAAELPSLPVVEEVEWGPFRAHCRQLIQLLERDSSPVPVEDVRQLRKLLELNPADHAVTAAEVQKLLDRYCLIAVNINAESRVKAARGPGEVQLQLDRPSLVLVKVHNEGGVTHALRVYGPELVRDGERDAGRWLEADFVTESSFTPELTGRRLEYRLLRLTPRQSGKREATFQFDVGQGTQDLGFRAEVPILFSIGKSDASPKRR